MFTKPRQPVGTYISDSFQLSAISASSGNNAAKVVITTSSDEWDSEAIAAQIKSSSMQGATSNSVLAPNQYQFLLLEKPGVADEELESTLRWKIKDITGRDPDTVVFDYVELPDTPRVKNMMYLIVVEKAVLESHIAQCRGMGLKPKSVTVPEVALLNLAKCVPDLVGSNCLLWVGESKTMVVFIDQGELIFSRSFDIGIARLGHQDYAVALESLVLELQRSLDYYESQVMQKPVKSVLVLPREEINAVGFVDTLDQQLGAWVKPYDVTLLDDYTRGLEYDEITRGALALGSLLEGVNLETAN